MKLGGSHEDGSPLSGCTAKQLRCDPDHLQEIRPSLVERAFMLSLDSSDILPALATLARQHGGGHRPKRRLGGYLQAPHCLCPRLVASWLEAGQEEQHVSSRLDSGLRVNVRWMFLALVPV